MISRLSSTEQVKRKKFHLKGIKFSKRDPPESISDDEKSITFLGMTWFPKNDQICFNIKKKNLQRNKEGESQLQQ